MAEIAAWAAAVESGEPRALARALTVVENRGAEAEPLLRALFAASGRATLIGVTGAPGAGKSTLLDHLARQYRHVGERVGIVAVDPSSPFSRGAILGDRIRMQSHSDDPGIFIRSMASRGSLGGLAEATADAALVLDAAGCARVLVETVGVGQGEVDIARLADIVLVVLVPGMGDEVQTLKAGILEIGDVFVVNKADRGPERLQQELRSMLGLARRPDGWVPPVVATVASDGGGVAELEAAIAAFANFLAQDGRLAARRQAHWRERLAHILRERLYDAVLAPRLDGTALEQAAREVSARRADPYSAADALIARGLAGAGR